MLKIRDDVNLKELEKYGFKKYEYTHLLVLRKEEHDFACIDIRNKRYEILDICNLTYNITYDLIKANLVVKE
jgi:glutathione peroxidase-family protein